MLLLSSNTGAVCLCILVLMTVASNLPPVACQGTFSMQQLRSQLATATPGTVFQIPEGVYIVDSPLLLPSGVILLGAGMDSTQLLLNRDLGANFKYGYVIAPKGASTGVYVGGLTINGARTVSTSNLTLAANIGGGLSVGSSWTVERVRFTNINYFKLWARNVTNVTIRHLVFEDLNGTTSGDNDNIGGGRIDSVLIENCTVMPSARGNGLDVMRSRNITLLNNRFLGSATAGSHNVYLEAVTDSLVRNNRLEYSSISLQSDVSYSDTVVAVNPSGNTVQGNTVINPVVQGISVRYDNGTVQSQPNTITSNTVIGAGTSGIVTFAFAAGLLSSADVVTSNIIIDPFRRGTDKEWNTGYGITKSAGITLGAGPCVAGGNSITSTATPAGATQLWSGTQVGLRSTRKITVNVQWVAQDTVSGATNVQFFQPV